MAHTAVRSFGGGVYVYTIKFKEKTRNRVVNAVAQTAATTFGGGVYVYTIKFKEKTRNPMVNAVAHTAVRLSGGGVRLHNQMQGENKKSDGKCSGTHSCEILWRGCTFTQSNARRKQEIRW